MSCYWCQGTGLLQSDEECPRGTGVNKITPQEVYESVSKGFL